LRFLVPACALGYLLTRFSAAQLLASFRSIPASAIVIGVATYFVASAIAALRWWLLFRACGCRPPARWLELLRLYWIGVFYNTYMPGGLGGDVVRGIATRSVEGGAARALGIVLLERMLGLCAMLLLVGTACWLFPIPGIPGVALGLVLGMGAGGSVMVALLSAGRLAPFLPPRLARVAASLPRVRFLQRFFLAFVLSLAIQFSGVIVGHAFISSVSTHVAFAQSVVIVPLINAMQYFPFTIGGAGVREAGYVVLYRQVGVQASDAFAVSLAIGVMQYAVSSVGGLLHWWRPIGIVREAGQTELELGKPR
jgi:hypothetical protein